MLPSDPMTPIKGSLPPVYPILDTASLALRGLDLVEAAEGLLEGGARILQFRHKEFWSRRTFEAASRIASLCLRNNAGFIINDRADYAALLNAGLHLGQDDLTPADARRVIGDRALLGFSTHNRAQMSAAQNEPIQYLAIGPVFPTLSKQKPDPTAGIETLREARALTSKPLVAIGGITRETAGLCWAAGADSVAVIADLLPQSCTKRNLRERMAEWLKVK